MVVTGSLDSLNARVESCRHLVTVNRELGGEGFKRRLWVHSSSAILHLSVIYLSAAQLHAFGHIVDRTGFHCRHCPTLCVHVYPCRTRTINHDGRHVVMCICRPHRPAFSA
jgi:hypothetical protein